MVFAPDRPATVVLLVVLAVLAVVLVAWAGARLLAVLPAVLALALAVTAGAVWVNVSYGYYQAWGDAFADLSGHPLAGQQPDPVTGATPQPPGHGPGHGRLVTVDLAGPASHLSRPAVVWLPAAYDDPTRPDRRFPVVELIRGDPGEPRGFVYGMHVDQVVDELQATGRMTPTVIVMPTASTGWHGQQCLDAVGGPADGETYLTQDVPSSLAQRFRVDAPGPHWVVAGLSEGGYCAADLALRHPALYAGAASLDGYYSPITAGGLGARLFGPDPARRQAAQQAATPQLLAEHWALAPAPAFWVMSGDGDAGDLRAARAFGTVIARTSTVRTVTVLGGTHTTPAWRTALPDLLTWAGGLLQTGTAQGGTATVAVQR